jgi:hypothetical protein
MSQEDDQVADDFILSEIAELEDLPLKIRSKDLIQCPGFLGGARLQDHTGESSEANIFVIQGRDRFINGTRYVLRIIGDFQGAVLFCKWIANMSIAILQMRTTNPVLSVL